MALRKDITLPSALVVNYHRIGGLFIHDSERILEIHLQSFRDEDTRREVVALDGGATAPKWQPAATPVVKVSGSDFSELFGAGTPEYPTKADLYIWLQTSEKSPLAGAAAV